MYCRFYRWLFNRVFVTDWKTDPPEARARVCDPLLWLFLALPTPWRRDN